MNRSTQKPRRGAWAAAAIVAAASAPALAQVEFTPRDIFTGANGAFSVFAADLNGDGDTDVLSASQSDDTVRWYMNDGANVPTFTPRVIFAGAEGAFSVFAADMDGDGDTDILSASAGDDTIRWYENDGASVPTFTPRVIFTGADGARSVFAADMDGDGDTDVLSASYNDDTIRWYENDGASVPAFTPHDIFTGADAAHSVFAADVDGDGDTDILSASEFDNAVRWYENDGATDPGFTPHEIFTNAAFVRSVFAADVDGDGDTDVLSASTQDDAVRWYENGGGADPRFIPREIFTGADGANSVFAADMDGDGDTDVLSTSIRDNRIRWYENDGGRRPQFTPRDIFGFASSPTSVFATDVDRDSVPDVLSASIGDSTIRWYESESPPEVLNTTAMTGHATIADAIGAASVGDDLLASARRFTLEPSIDFLGKGVSLWSQSSITQGTSDIYRLADDAVIAAAPGTDMDLSGTTIAPVGAFAFLHASTFTLRREGALELGVASGVFIDAPLGARVEANLDLTANSTLGVSDDLVLPADPEFTDPNDIFTGADGARSVFAADVDGDGDTDVLSASFNDSAIRWYENGGGVNPRFIPRAIFTPANGAASVYAADVDGDGATDVLSASSRDNVIRWYKSDGAIDPSFTPRDIFTDADEALCVFAADVDGDGDTDVLSASFDDDTIRWYENDGAIDPSFTPHEVFTSAAGAVAVFATDVDGDGDTDVLSASFNDGTIRWYENDGAVDPSFTPRDIFTDAPGAFSVFAADMDGDGDTDVLSGSADDTIRWYENDGASDPTFTPRDVFADAPGAFSVFAADVDSDGDTDILSASADDTIRWYENDGADDPAFTPRDIFADAPGALSVFAADMDGDGDTDVLSASQGDNTIRWYEQESDTVHTVRAGALLVAGDAVTIGARTDVSGTVAADGDFINASRLSLFSGTVAADGGLTNRGIVTGFGDIDADVVNDHVVTIQSGTNVAGDYINNGATTIQSGTLTVLGELTNNGEIVGDFGGLDPRGERSGGLFIESDLTLGAAATLRMPSERARLSAGGNVDIAINSSTRFDMSLAELRMVGVNGAQSLEVMSADLGARPGGPGMPETDFRIGTLRVGPIATSVTLVDNRDNDGNGQQDSEVIYATNIVIEAGATLNTNGRRVYYETLTLDGAVDEMDNLIQFGVSCAADWDENGVVNSVDVGAFLTEYFEDLANGTLLTDFDGNGVVNAADVGAFLSQYFEDLANPDCNGG